MKRFILSVSVLCCVVGAIIDAVLVGYSLANGGPIGVIVVFSICGLVNLWAADKISRQIDRSVAE